MNDSYSTLSQLLPAAVIHRNSDTGHLTIESSERAYLIDHDVLVAIIEKLNKLNEIERLVGA